MSLPAADDLFRPTATPAPDQAAPAAEPEQTPAPAATPAPEPEPEQHERPTQRSKERNRRGPEGRAPSGRVRHDEKMTVYVTSDELLDLEHARLTLRRHHGLGVDRGRLVREAVAMALEDLEEHGGASQIVRRLQQG